MRVARGFRLALKRPDSQATDVGFGNFFDIQLVALDPHRGGGTGERFQRFQSEAAYRFGSVGRQIPIALSVQVCLLYTSDAADE